MRIRASSLLAIAIPVVFWSCSIRPVSFASSWPENTTRFWIGPEYWANRLQDWRIHNGRLECIDGTRPLRTVHLLTHWLGDKDGNLEMSVRTGIVSGRNLDSSAWGGFLIGAGSLDLDYRARAIIHHSSGQNGGLVAALDGNGAIVFYDNEDSLKTIKISLGKGDPFSRFAGEDIELKVSMQLQDGAYIVTLSARDYKTGRLLSEATIDNVDPLRLAGNIAIVANGGAGPDSASFWFRDWNVSGARLEVNKTHQFGPVLGALHTLSNGVLKMTVQMPPVAETDPQTVRLQIAKARRKKWRTVAEENITVPGWTATFRVSDWDDAEVHKYRVVYSMPVGGGELRDYFFEGAIRKDPVDENEIVVAAFTGNSNTSGSFQKNFAFTDHKLWFPHADIVNHVKARKPHLLVFTGDQVYESRPTSPDRSGEFSSYLDYLYKWYLWCWAYGELARDIPAVCLPDDHDVYHGNIWGAGGIKARSFPADGIYPDHYQGFEGHWRQDGGGYVMPADFVKMVERTQTSHLPDPYDPTPVAQGIGVYYTGMTYGGISFAILEDRKFKSSPSLLVPEGQVVNGFVQNANFEIQNADVPGAKLLGDRQLDFLQDWAADWRGAWMKVALSQTLFANLSTYPEHFKTDRGAPRLRPVSYGVIPEGYELARDMDSNGWPQTGRNRALRELRRGFAFMIGGDQHLGSIIHHGIDEWGDAGFSLCVPSIANLWPRRWYPPSSGVNRKPGMPSYTGSYLDGFGNHITVWAVSNPVISGHEPSELHDRAPGYGVVRLNKKGQTITIECWPRYADPGDPMAKQYPGWPMTISLLDNYGQKARAYLPDLRITGKDDPVVQVIKEKEREVVYTIRAKNGFFRPKVFALGEYTIRVGEPGVIEWKKFEHLEATESPPIQSLLVEF